MSSILEYKKANLIKDCVNVVLGYLLNLNNIEYKVMPHVYTHLKEEWNKRFDASFWPTVDNVRDDDDFITFIGEIIEVCVVSSRDVDVDPLYEALFDFLRDRLVVSE